MENKREEYHLLFEKLINVMTSFSEYDQDALFGVLGEVLEFYHLTRGVVTFYRSLSHERMDAGEVFPFGQESGSDKMVLQERYVTNTLAVTVGRVYAADGEAELTEEEKSQLELFLRVVMNFVRRRRLQFAIERLGYHDETGYPNLRSFFRFLDQLGEKKGLFGYTAALFNLRHFSLINEEIGRENGDAVMRNYFQMAKTICSEDGIVCRLGGDNFLAAFPNECLPAFLELAKGVPVAYGEEADKRVMVSSSAGLFQFPEGFHMTNSGEVMDKLMPASSVAKRDEKGSIVFYSDEMIQQKTRQMSLQRDFPQAIKNREFQVYYQPKVDVMTGEIVGAEALVRWFRDGKLVMPMEFIPILEQNTDICTLDFYVLDMVCRDIKNWLAQGRRVVCVSVNLSRKHMLDPDLLEHIMEIVNRYDIPHEFIEIELTETTTDVEFRDLKRVVGGLQKVGIRTSVDDFGIGYSSLNLIREIPWNTLKIDKSFLPVDQEGNGSTTFLMYKHVIAMAKDIGMECITEGVETERQEHLLKENGCRIAQGFRYDKPLPIGEYEKRLDKRFYEK